ncbi:acyl-CoA dehydrogenase family protein [Nocardioides massiliensis]|nr:acyl-CoA dehydrogenase family protein [Nocardioides massiliensis]
MWAFETEPGYQAQLDWADEFVRTQVEPLDLTQGSPFDPSNRRVRDYVRVLQDEVRAQGLWACHLGPELGGQGYGQMRLALLNEVIGRSVWAPLVFGCQAPDSGNAEILARFGTAEQKKRFLEPLLNGQVCSTYAMTEPHAGADPTLFTTTAVRDGDWWVINGEKWFATNARYAAFLIVMCVTDPDADAPHRRMSMFLVPAGTPGVELVRSVGVGTDKPGEGTHGYLRFHDVRVASDAMLGEQGAAFAVAQTRLGGGRIHHAMRTISQVRAALDAMCERAVARTTRGGSLADLGVVQQQVADSWTEIEQFRLLVLRTAWLIDKHQDYRKVRGDIAAVKALMPGVFSRVVQRAMHLHGALGVSEEMPFVEWMGRAEVLGIADGPTEVHQQTLARVLLRSYEAPEGIWPSAHIPTRREAALTALEGLLDPEVTGA